eukprot:jgi/Chrzof1/9693/Cz04g12120.t1_PPD7[v5.2]
MHRLSTNSCVLQRTLTLFVKSERRHSRCGASKQLPQPEQDDSNATTSSGPRLQLSDPVQTVTWGGKLPNRRRAVVGGLTALGIALGGNLGGCTSFLLGLDGGNFAHQVKLDVVVPVKGFRRCVDYQYGFEFLYPSSWLGDQTLLKRAAQRAELERSLDPPALKRQRARDVVEPCAAFGPAGSSGEENISVIVAPIYEGFRLDSLGQPTDAAQRFLTTTAAPPGSNKQAQLVTASSNTDETGQLYYLFEYTIKGPAFYRHNLSVLSAQDNLLYTLNVQCPQDKWVRDGAVLQQAAQSFKLLTDASQGSQFPNRL